MLLNEVPDKPRHYRIILLECGVQDGKYADRWSDLMTLMSLKHKPSWIHQHDLQHWITKNINSYGCKEKSYRWLMKAISAVVSVLWCESAKGQRLLCLVRVTDRVGFTYLNLYAISFLKPRGRELPLFAGCGWICGLGLREVKCVFWSCVNKAMRWADVAAAFVQIHT